MQVSGKKLNRNLERQIFKVFYQLMADLKDPEEARIFFNGFLSDPARLSLAKKLMIALFLDQKRGYQEIKQSLKVSSSTVAEVDKNLADPGIQLALKKIKADIWAEDWSKKISQVLGRILPKK